MTWPWVGEAIASWGSRGLGVVDAMERSNGEAQWRRMWLRPCEVPGDREGRRRAAGGAGDFFYF